MANLAFDSSVTLVVKTPNQKVDDLKIDCALEWTVKQLKGHLSRVYPTKPESQHQRLIYSGQLLNDNLILKDVLREHEGGNTHTLHLVCPMKGDMSSATDSQATSGPSTPASLSSSTGTTPSTPVTAQTTPDGLRYRGNATPPYPQFNMYHQQMANAVYQFPVQGNGYPMPPFMAPPYWMQQMVAQQMAAGGVPQPMMYMPPNYGFPQMPYPWLPQPNNYPAPQAAFMTPPPQHMPQTPPQQPVNQVQPPQQRANENVQANAGGGPLFDDDDDDENANRDWLDKIYTLCRVAILLSIFWFYSSTGRFLVLIISLVLIYLYQTGILQIFRRNRNNLGEIPLRQEIPPPPPEVPQQEQGQEAEVLNRSQSNGSDDVTDNNDDSDHDDDETDATAQQPAPPAPPPGPSATTVAYNFVISFFTSLFPNGPPQN